MITLLSPLYFISVFILQKKEKDWSGFVFAQRSFTSVEFQTRWTLIKHIWTEFLYQARKVCVV